jgi:ABC-type nitrate/sulfonate/bicarbonate transport system ATPase subunit
MTDSRLAVEQRARDGISNAVELVDVCCAYRTAHGQDVRGLNGCTLAIPMNSSVAVVGASASGKTTLLKTIAGLRPVDCGHLGFPGYGDKRPADAIGVMFQGSSHFPWRTVERNLSFRLELAGWPKAERQRRAAELCQLVGMEPTVYLRRYPSELSGGQLRRMELAMTFSAVPRLWLLDEATTGLDFLARQDIQKLIEAMMLQSGITTLMVTHDVPEAVRLADLVAVMSGGRICALVPINLPRPRTAGGLPGLEADQARLVDQIVVLMRSAMGEATRCD